jgi:hypothetical protein
MESKIWEFPSCDCTHCNGGTNKHAWAFYYYCKRMGDDVTMASFGDTMEMRIYD